MNDRRRNIFVLLIVAGLFAASVAVIALKPTKLGLELKGGVQLVYQAKPTAQSKVDPESLERSIDIMRTRVDQLGVAQPEIQRSGAQEIDVDLPDVSNAQRAEAEVGKTAQLYFYDWEPNVIGPTGKPAGASEPTVTGGADAGSSESGLPEYQAVLRAAKRPAILRKTDTTLAPGCTPEQVNGCIYGSWYLLDTAHEKMLCAGGKPICEPQETEQNLYADGYKPPAGSKPKAVRVNPGTILLQARPVESPKTGKVTQPNPNSFYVLNDEPVLTGADIKNPQQGFDEGGGGTGAPNVNFGFTSHGKGVFQRVTKEIAHRGQEAQLPGVSKEAAQQHFAVALDGQLITAPSIDYTQYPEGIDSSQGSQISGGFTITSAQALADELQSGALPIRLELISNSQVSATLGKTALHQSLIAGIIGFAVVCLFLLLFYRVLGVIAVGGLIVYGTYLFALIKLIPITLTLPGIAGLILTIGVCRGREHRDLRARQGGDPGRALDRVGDRDRVHARVRGDRRRQRGDVHDRVHPVRAGDRGSQGVRVHAGHRHARVAVHGGARHARRAGHDGALAAGEPSLGARRGQAQARVDVRLHGRLEVVLLAVGHDPLDRRAGDRRQGPELRHRLQVRHAHPDGVRQARHLRRSERGDERRGLSRTRRCRSTRAKASAAAGIRSRPRN